jgi:hypothetical protein
MGGGVSHPCWTLELPKRESVPQEGPRAGAVASVFIVKPSMAGLHSLLRRAIFAHSQNQQQQIRLQTVAKAPALHGSQLRSVHAEIDFWPGQRVPGVQCRGLSCQAGDAAAMQSPAGGCAGREPDPGSPGDPAGSVRSLAGRRARRHRRGIGLASLRFQRWPSVPGPQVFPGPSRPGEAGVGFYGAEPPSRPGPRPPHADSHPRAALRAPSPGSCSGGAGRGLSRSGPRWAPCRCPACLRLDWQLCVLRGCRSTRRRVAAARRAPLTLAPEPRPRGWRGPLQLLPTPRGPAPPPGWGGGRQSPPLSPLPAPAPARRLDPLQVPGSAALPACERGPRAPTPLPAQMSDAGTGYGPTWVW